MAEEEKNDIEVNTTKAEAQDVVVTDEADDKNKKSAPEQDKKKAFFKEIISWVEVIVFAVVLAYLITTFLVVNARVPSGSMENTVMTGDRLMANRLSYIASDPERFDIVVFKYPDDESKLYIKRIIGLPGDTVEVRDNEVYINGSDTPLDDSFLKETMVGSSDAVYQVPEDSYFMMGDNRNSSNDSRYWNNKFVKREKILGKAVFKYFPNFEILVNK